MNKKTSSTANRPGDIIPKEAASLSSLTATMAVMCYLACLAIGALILIDRAVDGWTRGLAQEVTVQIKEQHGRDIEADVASAAQILADTSGIKNVQVLDRVATEKLLEPWLGTVGLDALPVPRLLAVTVNVEDPPDYNALTAKLQSEVPSAELDTHQRWEAELTRMAGTLAVLSLLILALISGSAIAMVIFATRAVLDANRQTVDVLHLVGAEDHYIARAINRRFLMTGLVAGSLGLVLALLTFYALGNTGLPQTEGLATASRSLFSMPNFGDGLALIGLLSVPLVATALALVTSRVTLMRMLGRIR
jgi:cell division transport system permease protein